ncbi:MAG: FMN-binding protein [Clostridia bacterium]|nr:FMN-binding protein [Clostridia bacterium]
MSEDNVLHEKHVKSPSPFLDFAHFKTALILLLITGLVAILLGVTNGMTKDRIAEIAAEKADAARKSVLPTASVFTDLNYSSGSVLSVFEARDGAGALVGFAVETGAPGFGGNVDQIVGLRVSEEGGAYVLTVSGVSLLDISDETPGVGSRVSSSGFLKQFEGQTASSLAESYDALSGATYSSEGVHAGVEEALSIAARIIQNSGGNVK